MQQRMQVAAAQLRGGQHWREKKETARNSATYLKRLLPSAAIVVIVSDIAPPELQQRNGSTSVRQLRGRR